jgi:hypothetical protein
MTDTPDSTLFCTNCGQKLTDADQFCPECGNPRPATPTPPVSPPPAPIAATPPPSYSPPPMSYSPAMAMMGMTVAPFESSKPILNFDVEYPERLSRLLIFVKWLLVIPHLLVLYILAIVLSLTTLFAWFAILFTGRYPRGMWDFGMGVMRWQANVTAYYMLQRDEYPPFSGSAPYPVRFEMAYPERLSRLLIFVKWLLIIPNVFVYFFILFAVYVVEFIAFFAILFTGKFPRGLFDFTTGAMRWGYRLNAYVNLFTDAYPPFSTAP